MNKKIFLATLSAVFLMTATNAFAAGENNGAYGQPCPGGYGQNDCFTNIVVDKTVQNPKSLKYVNDLEANDERFNPGQKIKFQIKITNTGNITLKNIEVKDTLPPYLELVKGFGKYDKNTREMTLTIDKLDSNETKTLNLEAKVLDAKKLPGDQSITCTLNHVSARSEGDMDEDNSRFCIQTKVFKVMAPPAIKQTPSTGPEMIALFGLIPAGLTGIFLRRKTNAKS